MASNYPVSFYFELSFKGEDAAFQEVSGLSKELGIEEVTCGGENRFKYRLPTVTSSQNLVLKRALIPEGSQLIDWCASCIDEGLSGTITTHNVSVSLLAQDGSVCAMWTFYNAYPVKYSVSDFKSQDNSLVVETIELAYTYFAVAPNTMFGNLFD
ncbi:MAG TPA: phage tail protein [Flavobacteriales bacterium]|nr:phage tail protein [Flavobacteriales bacterium]